MSTASVPNNLFDFFIPNLTTHLIQKFMQNVTFLLWHVLLTKGFWEWLKFDYVYIIFWIRRVVKLGVKKVKRAIIWNGGSIWLCTLIQSIGMLCKALFCVVLYWKIKVHANFVCLNAKDGQWTLQSFFGLLFIIVMCCNKTCRWCDPYLGGVMATHVIDDILAKHVTDYSISDVYVLAKNIIN